MQKGSSRLRSFYCSEEINVKQCIFELKDDNYDVLSQEELDKIEEKDIEFLKNLQITRFIEEINSYFTKKTFNLEPFEVLIDKEQIILYNKLFFIYNLKKTDK